MSYVHIPCYDTPVHVWKGNLKTLFAVPQAKYGDVKMLYSRSCAACWGCFFGNDYQASVESGENTLVIPHSRAWFNGFGKCSNVYETALQEDYGLYYYNGYKVDETELYNDVNITSWFEFCRNLYGISRNNWNWHYNKETSEWVHFVSGVDQFWLRLITSSVRLVWEYPLLLNQFFASMKLLPDGTYTKAQQYRLWQMVSIGMYNNNQWDKLGKELGITYNGKFGYVNSGHWVMTDSKAVPNPDVTFHSNLLTNIKEGSSSAGFKSTHNKLNVFIGRQMNSKNYLVTGLKPTKEGIVNYIMNGVIE